MRTLLTAVLCIFALQTPGRSVDLSLGVFHCPPQFHRRVVLTSIKSRDE